VSLNPSREKNVVQTHHDQKDSRPHYEEAAHELMLTRSMGGTLGAAAIDGSPEEENSEFSSQANSFLWNPVGKNSNPEKSGQQAPRRESLASYGSVKRSGLFDVFAPAGYIGIIVDTTKYGPAVHSLKPTSPMLGLINPGDLIVGLDDQDTRGMTAGTLTKLMAQKAGQKERKITLLAKAE
jgi:hypothetical protein